MDALATANNLIHLDDERELIERAKRDREGFAALYRAHCRAISGYVFRRVGDPHTCEDLVADVFTIALRDLPRFEYRGVPIRSWLFRIATNRINRWARRERRRAMQRLNHEPLAPESNDTPDGLTGQDARAALLTLAPRYQTVLALHYLEGMPVAEVARTLGCRPGTVKSRLSRGRDALRRRLQQRRSL